MGVRFVDGYPMAMSLVRRAAPSTSLASVPPGSRVKELDVSFPFFLPGTS